MVTTVPAPRPAVPRLDDPRLDVPDDVADLDLLTGDEATELVRAALAGAAAPGTLPAITSLAVEVAAVHHRPGVGVSVCYDARHGGAPDGEVIVASTAPSHVQDREDRVALLDDGVRRVRVWRRADDPALPGLREAVRPDVVAAWLGRDELPAVAVLGYRPTRRAVLVARFSSGPVFLKVVRPRRADDLVRRHEVMQGAAVPAPPVLGRPAPGVVLIGAAPGISLAEALASGDPARVPTPESVLAALDSLPAPVLQLRRRPSWVDRLDFHAAGAVAALPHRADDVRRVEAGVRSVLAAAPEQPWVPTHGDVNVANLFVDGGRPSTLIDVDSLGPGRRVDDLATLLAHLSVLPALAPAVYGGVPAVLARWRPVLERSCDARALRACTAAVLVSLVANTAPDQGSARLDLALAEVARAAHGRNPL